MEELFRRVGQIVQQSHIAQEESRKRGEQFNLFAICGVNHYEMTHSAILAELLDPQGSHGQGTLFLEAFLVLCTTDFVFSLEGTEVYKEFATPDGRIDILLTNRKGQALIIENKIYANDQAEQLMRYDAFAQRRFGKGNYEILYLTLYSDSASEGSAGNVQYKRLSYCVTIVGWLEECIRLSCRLPMVRETLIQYQNHLMNLTNQDMCAKEKEQLFQLMAAHAAETAAIVKAATNDYLQYVYQAYVKKAFEDFARERGLLYHEHDEMNIGDGFHFHRPAWKKTAIKVCVEGGLHYIGVSSTFEGTDVDFSTLEQKKLDCLASCPTMWWPYGWQWLGEFSDWSASGDAIPAMIDGRFSSCVLQMVDAILSEIERKKVVMF